MLGDALKMAALRFVSAVQTLTDAELRRPSRLPEWSRGHVVAHVVLNAEGFVTAAHGLAANGLGLMYPAGVEARQAAIDALSKASGSQLLGRLTDAHTAFLESWDPPPDEAPCATAADTPRFSSSTVPSRRLRELQVHLVDLGIDGVDHDGWLDEFVDSDLPLQWQTVELRAPHPIEAVDEHGSHWSANVTGGSSVPVPVNRRALLAWTLDRFSLPELPVLTPWGDRSRWETDPTT